MSIKKINILIFGFMYSLIGSYLTTLSYFIYKSNSILENPKLIFLTSFILFFFISLLSVIYFDYANKLTDKSNYNGIKISGILTLLVLFSMFFYTINSLKNLDKNYSVVNDFSIIQERERNIENFNRMIVYTLITLVFLTYLGTDIKEIMLSNKIKFTQKIKLVLILIVLLGILIPLSSFLDILIRIVGFAIGLAGGLWKSKNVSHKND